MCIFDFLMICFLLAMNTSTWFTANSGSWIAIMICLSTNRIWPGITITVIIYLKHVFNLLPLPAFFSFTTYHKSGNHIKTIIQCFFRILQSRSSTFFQWKMKFVLLTFTSNFLNTTGLSVSFTSPWICLTNNSFGNNFISSGSIGFALWIIERIKK